MSKKYVIEIKPEYEDSFKGLMILGAKDSNLFVDVLAANDVELLNSDYINEYYGESQDGAYQRGLDDAWEAAKKIFGYKIDGGIPIEELEKVFGYAKDETFCTADIIRHNTAAEAIEKLKAYEEKQKVDDEIKVRDEVIVYGCRGVVTYVHDNLYTVMMHDGSCGNWGKRELKKTGKKHDIDKILEELKE